VRAQRLAAPAVATVALLLLALVPAEATTAPEPATADPTATESTAPVQNDQPGSEPSPTESADPSPTESVTSEEPGTESSTSERSPQTTASTSADVLEDVRAAMLAHRDELRSLGVRDLGEPVGEPVAVFAGYRWTFERGTMFWTTAYGAKALWGTILSKYHNLGGPGSVLGFPISDEQASAVDGARRARFERGRIYWSRDTGAHEIHGDIARRYVAAGERRFGIPVSDEVAAGRGRMNRLQKARIYWSAGTGARIVYGAILDKYIAIGAARSWIGLPTREEFDVPDGRRAAFLHAAIEWSRITRRARVAKPFSVTVHPVSAADVQYTYRSGCPVGPSSLRRMRLVFTNFAGDAAMGNLIVHRSAVEDMTRVFGNAHRERFHVRKVRPMDFYGGDDIRAMADDNTSAFNCRHVTGNPYRLSQHSYGNAIDINTVENPYVTATRVYPAGSQTYLNRGWVRKGMIIRGDVVAGTMRNRGWLWGARWTYPDYQHFSANGG
jgi:D-alanyl-D-alanine carboxypeptidase/LGFP repeat